MVNVLQPFLEPMYVSCIGKNIVENVQHNKNLQVFEIIWHEVVISLEVLVNQEKNSAEIASRVLLTFSSYFFLSVEYLIIYLIDFCT